MKCPHCDYEYGYLVNTEGNVEKAEGAAGGFYKLRTALHDLYLVQEGTNGYCTAKLYGCPSCYKTFIEE